MDYKRKIIIDAIVKAKGSKTRAASILGLAPTYLSRLIKQLDVEGTKG